MRVEVFHRGEVCEVTILGLVRITHEVRRPQTSMSYLNGWDGRALFELPDGVHELENRIPEVPGKGIFRIK
jgi:hypothetical protein